MKNFNLKVSPLYKVSIILLAWLIVLRKVPNDYITWCIFGFFVVIGVFAMAAESR